MGRTYSEDESVVCSTTETSSNQAAPGRTSDSIGRFEWAGSAATACCIGRLEWAGGAATTCCIGPSTRATANRSSAGASADAGAADSWLRWSRRGRGSHSVVSKILARRRTSGGPDSCCGAWRRARREGGFGGWTALAAVQTSASWHQHQRQFGDQKHPDRTSEVQTGAP